MPERRKVNRRDFSYYMRLMNERTGELVGHLADISTGGFRLESRKPIIPNLDFLLRMDLTNAVSNKDYLVFSARSKWCERHHVDPTLYNVGFQITEISPADLEVFTRIFEKYGVPAVDSRRKDNTDYLWR